MFSLKFQNPDEEEEFRQYYLIDKIPMIQIALLFGGILFYIFFIYDQIIDPDGASFTQFLRGVVFSPIIWIGAAPLFIKRLDRWFELILLMIGIYAIVGNVIIHSYLRNGFNFVSLGGALLIFFSTSLINIRVQYLFIGVVLALSSYNFGQAISVNRSANVFIFNNLCLVSACAMGLSVAIVREKTTRQQFLATRKLQRSEREMEQLVSSVLSAESLARIKERVANPTGSPRITVSYRRSDSDAISGRIRDRLASYFGATSVFMDVDAIPFGTDFRDYIRQALEASDVLLAVIGPDWLGRRSDGSLRIFDQDDPIRLEIQTALQCGISILPILVNGASIPTSDELPEPLRSLANLNAAEVHAGRDFSAHVERLIRSVEGIAL